MGNFPPKKQQVRILKQGPDQGKIGEVVESHGSWGYVEIPRVPHPRAYIPDQVRKATPDEIAQASLHAVIGDAF